MWGVVLSKLLFIRTTADVWLQLARDATQDGDLRVSLTDLIYPCTYICVSSSSTVEILKNLDHPNIVRAMETFDYHNRVFIVLELCSGGDLYTRDPYTEEAARKIISCLFQAVRFVPVLCNMIAESRPKTDGMNS